MTSFESAGLQASIASSQQPELLWWKSFCVRCTLSPLSSRFFFSLVKFRQKVKLSLEIRKRNGFGGF
jgi:hypothetical protein